MLPKWLPDVEIYYMSVTRRTLSESLELCKRLNPKIHIDNIDDQLPHGFIATPNRVHFATFRFLEKLLLWAADLPKTVLANHHTKFFIIDEFWFIDQSILSFLRSLPNVKILAVGSPTVLDKATRNSDGFWKQVLLDDVVDGMLLLLMYLRRLGITLPKTTIDMMLKYLAIEEKPPEPKITMTTYDKVGQEISFGEFMGMWKKHSDSLPPSL